jgi:cation diffusion facilitator CzcD-associated flavoprotein CzcO
MVPKVTLWYHQWMAESSGDAVPVRVAVIGAGMAGILSAIRLTELGIGCVVFEKADRVGGTWRENTYPGLSCDVPAHSYTYSFARNPDWSRWFAEGPEIQRYFERVAHDHDVLRHVRFADEVVSLTFIDGQWHVATAAGHRDVFDAVIAATGVLHHPSGAHFDGIETFTGRSFHSARWDHSVPLDGRRVGVIGTGSTAVQITSALVPRVERFDLFQRTAQWVYPAPNPFYTEAEKAAFRADPAAFEQLIGHLAGALNDRTANAVIDVDSPLLAEIEQRCQENLDTVRDPDLRKRLTPTYRAMCKRLIISPDFYETIQQPNANLVTDPIERIEPGGIRTSDGALHELDVLVIATGFRADRFVRPTTVVGRDGVELDDIWSDGPIAYLSVTVPGLPNFFMLNGPNGPVGNFSLIEIAERQLDYSLQLLEGIRRGDYREVSPTLEATQRFEEERREAAMHTVWASGCNSWYLDKRGVPASWTFTHTRFVDEMAAPRLENFEIR